MLELDLKMRPSENINRALALYTDDFDDEAEQNDSETLKMIEKDLDDFFDIQIYSTVYFGSQLEPH